METNRIVLYDNFHRNSLQHMWFKNCPSLTVIEGDVLDPEHLKSAMKGCNVVIHLASIAGVDTVLRMPVTTMKVALIGTYNMLEAALAQDRIDAFVDFSTSEVFGSYAYKVQEGDVTSLGAVGEARWTYAVSKLATEHLTPNYFNEFGLPGFSVRPFNIYGPGQVGEGAIHHFIKAAITGQDLVVHNDGSQIRAWCYIDDIISFLVSALSSKNAIGHVFNVGNPR